LREFDSPDGFVRSNSPLSHRRDGFVPAYLALFDCRLALFPHYCAIRPSDGFVRSHLHNSIRPVALFVSFGEAASSVPAGKCQPEPLSVS
jgi:hypothetical protein